MSLVWLYYTCSNIGPDRAIGSVLALYGIYNACSYTIGPDRAMALLYFSA